MSAAATTTIREALDRSGIAFDPTFDSSVVLAALVRVDELVEAAQRMEKSARTLRYTEESLAAFTSLRAALDAVRGKT